MRRRLFIKTGLIFVPTLSARAQLIINPYAFTGAPASCNTTRDSFLTASNGFSTFSGAASTDWLATQFPAGASYTACKLDVYLEKLGSPSFNMSFYFYDHNSGANTPGSQIGAGEATLAASAVSTGAEAAYTIDFADTSITSGTTYWLVVTTDSAGDGSNNMRWHRASQSTTNNIMQSGDGTTWSNVSSSRRSRFQLYSA